MEVLEFLKEHLENGRVLRTVELREEQMREIRHLNFLSLKPAFGVINADEDSFNTGKFKNTGFLLICGTLENEIIELPDDEISNFLNAMGIDEPVSKKIVRKAYEILNYISFLLQDQRKSGHGPSESQLKPQRQQARFIPIFSEDLFVLN